MQKLIVLFALSYLFLTGCTSSVTEPKIETTSSSSKDEAQQLECEESETCACDLPDGRSILSGEKLTMYRSSKPGCGVSCESQKIEIECTNGDLGLHSQFPAFTCEETECSACELPWGEQLAEGATISAFRDDVVNCKSECEARDVTCSNGRLVGANISTYSFPNCRIEKCIECTTPWGDKVGDGERVRGYASESVKCGNRCESTYLTCDSGKFDELDEKKFKFGACTQEKCVECITPWGTKLYNNQQAIAYKSGSVACDKSCLDNGNMQPRSCVDGVLTGDPSFKFGSCAPETCEEGGGAPGFVCRLPWSGAQALGGTEITAYSKQSVGCNDSCDKYQHLRKCRIEDGLFDGPPEAIYRNCTNDCKE